MIIKRNFNHEEVDKKLRQNVPSLILLCFAIEGVFGMPVAIYVDVSSISIWLKNLSTNGYGIFKVTHAWMAV